jgi:hypothetical protein
MQKYRIIIVTLCILVIAIPYSFAGNKKHNKSECSIAGLWTVVSSEGRAGLTTIVPLDNTGKRFASLGEATESFIVEGLGEFSESRGIYERTAPGVYSYTRYAYEIDGDFKIVTSGEAILVDCNIYEETRNWDFRWPPDENWCGTSTATGVRLTVEEELCEVIPE